MSTSTRKTLTEATLRCKPPTSGAIEVWDSIVPGLRLRIGHSGRRSFDVTTRLAPDGRQIKRKIGTTATHTLTEAREVARRIIQDAAVGLDRHSKAALREAARQARVEAERAQADSFRSVCEAYLGDPGQLGGAHLKSRKLVAQRLENHVFPRFADRRITEVTRAEIRDLLRELVKAVKPIAANRLAGNLKTIFKWAAENDKIAVSPISDLPKPAADRSRDRVLEDYELAAI